MHWRNYKFNPLLQRLQNGVSPPPRDRNSRKRIECRMPSRVKLEFHRTDTDTDTDTDIRDAPIVLLGPFHEAIAVPSVTRCHSRCCSRRCRCRRCRRGHRCAGGVWRLVRHLVNGNVAAARSGEWAQHFSNASCFVNVYTIAYRVQYTFTRVHARIPNGQPREDPREEKRACRTSRRTSRRGSSCVSGSCQAERWSRRTRRHPRDDPRAFFRSKFAGWHFVEKAKSNVRA